MYFEPVKDKWFRTISGTWLMLCWHE